MESSRFNVLKVVAYLELTLLVVAYIVSLHLVGIIPGAIVFLLIHYLIGRMEKMGMTSTAKRMLWVVAGIKLAQVWLHVNSFQKGLEWADANLPFGWTPNDGAWYLSMLLLLIDYFSLLAIGTGKQDEIEEAERKAESERATAFVANQAEAERMAHERAMAELALKTAENQSATERIRAEAEARAAAEILVKRAEAEIERERRTEIPQPSAPIRFRQAGSGNRKSVSLQTARRAELRPAGTEAGTADEFLMEYQRAIMTLESEGNPNPTQRQIGSRMVWRGMEGVTDKTIRNYLNGQRQAA